MGNQEKIKEALCRIDKGLEAINTDGDWLKFITFQSAFYNYSFGNTMLIYMQNPEATFVKGFKAWNKLGRYVKKGETGIAILAPCFRKEEADKEEVKDSEKRIISGFRIAYVFDLAQTAGDDSQIPALVKGLSGNGEWEEEVYGKIKDYISAKQPFEEVEGTAAKGGYSPETGRIRVRSDMDYVQKIKTIIHEYAHCIDFSLNPDIEISRNKRELVAESCAYIVSSRMGIDTAGYSIGYLKTWLKDKAEMKEIADTVQKVSAVIIDELAGVLGPAVFDLQEEPE